MSDSVILEAVKHVGTAAASFAGSFALIHWRLKRLEKNNERQDVTDASLIKEIHKMETRLIGSMSESQKRIHKRLDDHIENNYKDFKEIRAEFVSETHCESKMKTVNAK